MYGITIQLLLDALNPTSNSNALVFNSIPIIRTKHVNINVNFGLSNLNANK